MLGVMTNRIQIGSKMVCFCHCLVGSPHLKNSNPKNSKYLSPPHQPSICWLHHSQLYIRNMDWHNYHDPFDIFISGGFIVFSLSRLHLSCRTPGTNPYFCWKKTNPHLRKNNKTISIPKAASQHVAKNHQTSSTFQAATRSFDTARGLLSPPPAQSYFSVVALRCAGREGRAAGRLTKSGITHISLDISPTTMIISLYVYIYNYTYVYSYKYIVIYI